MTTNKPEVKRYNITIDKYDHPVPYETEHGQWVKYSSYKALQAEIERLRKMHQDAYQRGLQAGSMGLREMYDNIQAVKRQDAWDNTRLTEALMAAEERAERAEAENERLRDVLLRISEAISGYINESTGIAGYHMNGDIEAWGETDLPDLVVEADDVLVKEGKA